MSEHSMRWELLPEWGAWFLMLPNDGLTEQRAYGPFNATEAVWAGEVHGVPFSPVAPSPERADK